jgi:hypothetical protein
MAIMCVCVKIGTLTLVALGALKERYRTILYAFRVFTPAPGCATRDGMSRSELGCSKSSVFLYVRYTLRGPTSRPAIATPRHCSEEREEEMMPGGRKEAAAMTRTEQRSTTSPSSPNHRRPLDLRRPSSREQGKGAPGALSRSRR